MTITLPVSYTSVSLMIDTFPPSSSANVSSAQLSLHAGAAEAIINAKLARSFTLPFAVNIPMLQVLATDMAVYQLVSSAGANRPRDSENPWYVRFKAAMETLDGIARGDIPLIDSSGAVISGSLGVAEMYSDKEDYLPTFFEGPETAHKIDSDKVDDSLSDRDELLLTDRLI